MKSHGILSDRPASTRPVSPSAQCQWLLTEPGNMKHPGAAACHASVFARIEDCVIALSFSNLLHLRVWIGLVGPMFGQVAFIRLPATPSQVASVTICVFLMAAVIFLLL